MNLKKTAVASAVGATLAISGVAQVAQADGHEVSVYGRVNNVIRNDSIDLAGGGDADATNVKDIVSRLGVKASAPIDANTTAFAQYEFNIQSDSEASGVDDTRVALVGVRGDFGQIQVGNMWSTFYNMVGTHMDPTVTLGATLYSTGTDLPYRVSNAIQYSNSFGAVNVSAELRVADEDFPDDTNAEKIGASDGYAIGASFMATDNLLLAVAIDESSDAPGNSNALSVLTAGEDVTRTGFAVKYSMDNWWASLSWGQYSGDLAAPSSDDIDVAQTQLHAGLAFGDRMSAFIGFGSIDFDTSGVDDAEAITLGWDKKFGTSGFRVYYEGVLLSESDDSYGYEQDTHIAGLRMDF